MNTPITENILKLDVRHADEFTLGTHLLTHVSGITYNQLVDTFGEPTYTSEHSGDGKVNFNWVFMVRKNGVNEGIITIYDWKTYDEDYTRSELTRWNIGGHSHGEALEMIQYYLDVKLLRETV